MWQIFFANKFFYLNWRMYPHNCSHYTYLAIPHRYTSLVSVYPTFLFLMCSYYLMLAPHFCLQPSCCNWGSCKKNGLIFTSGFCRQLRANIRSSSLDLDLNFFTQPVSSYIARRQINCENWHQDQSVINLSCTGQVSNLLLS